MRITRAMRLRERGEGGEEASTSEELGDKDGGMALSFWALYPTYRRSKDADVAAALSENSATTATHCN